MVFCWVKRYGEAIRMYIGQHGSFAMKLGIDIELPAIYAGGKSSNRMHTTGKNWAKGVASVQG